MGSIETEFLLKFVSIDETGLLFLFHKVFYVVLKSVLAITALATLYKKGSFMIFLSSILNYSQNLKIENFGGSTLVHSYINKRSIKYIGIIGASTSLGITLFTSFFAKQKQNPAVQAITNYSGFNGLAGNYSELFRKYGSKFFFECAKTISTFTNAAFCGFLEPKEDVIR